MLSLRDMIQQLNRHSVYVCGSPIFAQDQHDHGHNQDRDLDQTQKRERDQEQEQDLEKQKERVIVKSLNETPESTIDPRLESQLLDFSPRSKAPGLATRIANSMSILRRNGEKEKRDPTLDDLEPIYIEFEQGDPRNPVNFSRSKKWAITCLACFSTLLASSASSTYNLGFDSMIRDLNCTEFQATIGLSLYALGFGVVPLVSASFSEEVGRQPLYYISAIGVMLMFLLIALAQNIQTVLIARFIQGGFGSTWATMVGGTIADIWPSHERGLPMALFAVGAVGGTGFGPLYAGWVQMNPKLEWRWIQWIQMIITALDLLLVPIIMTETRSSVILMRIAKRMRLETGNWRYRARIEDERMKLGTLIWVSCTRPIQLLVTEPVVASFSVTLSRSSPQILYILLRSVGSVFIAVHGFNTGQVGTVFVTLIISSAIGFATNFYQDHLYRKNFPARGPEARLYLACCAAVLVPCGMFIYAWSTFSHVPWIALAIGITVGIYLIHSFFASPLPSFQTCNLKYNCIASDLTSLWPFCILRPSGQSLCRNLAATAFPLFTQQMFANLSFKWANTLFGCIACVLMPIPFILFFYGPTIRSRSRFSRKVMQSL
ncbi:major facilitator superfamily domain-containing protein [Rhodocollybia butyracea]|uniref:Major facilitator superfamily domain-containing protein n=1 Tax=Rhodocollybia butyracea TaxID=206335 RepID=A0A9P5Q428_9AGAR|nr:major facilitator superfamily domain-containing protein [Rhodocollybia butyracea]